MANVQFYADDNTIMYIPPSPLPPSHHPKRFNWAALVPNEPELIESLMSQTTEEIERSYMNEAIITIKNLPRDARIVNSEFMILNQEQLDVMRKDESESSMVHKLPESIPDGSVVYMIRVYFNMDLPQPIVLYEPTNSSIVRKWRIIKHGLF
jgi:hypothetical protein